MAAPSPDLVETSSAASPEPPSAPDRRAPSAPGIRAASPSVPGAAAQAGPGAAAAPALAAPGSAAVVVLWPADLMARQLADRPWSPAGAPITVPALSSAPRELRCARPLSVIPASVRAGMPSTRARGSLPAGLPARSGGLPPGEPVQATVAYQVIPFTTATAKTWFTRTTASILTVNGR